MQQPLPWKAKKTFQVDVWKCYLGSAFERRRVMKKIRFQKYRTSVICWTGPAWMLHKGGLLCETESSALMFNKLSFFLSKATADRFDILHLNDMLCNWLCDSVFNGKLFWEIFILHTVSHMRILISKPPSVWQHEFWYRFVHRLKPSISTVTSLHPVYCPSHRFPSPFISHVLSFTSGVAGLNSASGILKKKLMVVGFLSFNSAINTQMDRRGRGQVLPVSLCKTEPPDSSPCFSLLPSDVHWQCGDLHEPLQVPAYLHARKSGGVPQQKLLWT